MKSIDVLPDEVLLAIFDFCAHGKAYGHAFRKKEVEAWHSLAHVCRRWRTVVLESPHRLDLRLGCTNKTPARDMLDIWPALPLSIRDIAYLTGNVDNIIAVLERRDRVDKIELFDIDGSPLDKVLAAMQEPFPKLTELLLRSYDKTAPVVPDSFLGGSSPRLQLLWLKGIPFPGLPKLLLSATHLVDIRLRVIPHSGYFSPEAMVFSLSTLTSLEELRIEFQSPLSRPDRASRRPPPPTRSVLPALTSFWFKGASEYLEIVVARIDAPQLNKLYITFFNQIVFDTPEFIQFICRTPMLKPLEKARVTFEKDAAAVKLSSQTSGKDEELEVRIPCMELDWQVSSMEQVCTSCLPPLPTLESLYIHENPRWQQHHWQDNIENALWLELLHPFTSVKNLYLSSDIARRIVPSLQELVRGRATEVLPTLQNILLESRQLLRSVHDGIQQVVAVRLATGHPIAVSYGQEVR